MNFRFLVNAFLLLFTISITTTSAAIPRLIAYQGILTDNAGNPVANGVQKVIFALYNDSAAGGKVWGDENQDVITRQGYFTVILGSKAPLDVAFDKQYWMQTTVNAKQLSPRVPFTASAYALRADTADVAMSLIGLDGLLAGRATAAHGHSVLLKQGKSETAVTVDTAGRVGIGTTAPKSQLHLQRPGETGVWGGLLFSSALENSQEYQTIVGNYGGGLSLSGGNQEGDGYTRSKILLDSSGLHFKTGAGKDGSETEKGVILNNGNFGIGTTTPASRLEIKSNIDTGWLHFSTTSGNPIITSTNDLGILVGYKGPFSQQPLLYLSASGSSVGIGTTDPKGKLDIVEKPTDSILSTESQFTVSNLVLKASHSGSESPRQPGIGPSLSFSLPVNKDPGSYWEHARILATPDNSEINDTRGRLYLQVRELYPDKLNGVIWNWRTGIMIQSSGQVNIPGNLVVNNSIKASGFICSDGGSLCPSDRRLKLNIIPIDTALSLINSITGVRYDWDRKSFPTRNFPETRQIGLIAQDVEKALPELVHTDSDGYKSLSYDKLTAVLVEAVKELKVENEKLKARVEALEQR